MAVDGTRESWRDGGPVYGGLTVRQFYKGSAALACGTARGAGQTAEEAASNIAMTTGLIADAMQAEDRAAADASPAAVHPGVLTHGQAIALWRLLMVSDPWPLDAADHLRILTVADSEAHARGYDRWEAAYRDFKEDSK